MDRRTAQIPIIEHEFSPEFEERMEQLINSHSKPHKRFLNTKPKKIILALAAVFILFITMVFSVTAIREPVVRFIVEMYERFSTVFFDKDGETPEPPTTLEIIFEPSWLPDGYELNPDMSMEAEDSRDVFYIQDNNVLAYSQSVLSIGLVIDTENTEAKIVLLNGREALLYHNKGLQTIVWDDGQYAFSLTGSVSANEILRMAESLEEKQ